MGWGKGGWEDLTKGIEVLSCDDH